MKPVLPPKVLLRIAALPKASIAEVLSIIADIFEAQITANDPNLAAVADIFEAQNPQKYPQVEAQNPQVEAQNPQVEAQKSGFEAQKSGFEAQNPQSAGYIFSSLSSLPREVSKKDREEETPVIVKPSTRMPCAREGFEDFWKAYPKRINRLEAIRKYEVAVKKGIRKEDILSAAKAYANETQNTEKKFIKAPDVWLHKGCYEDETLQISGNENSDARTPEERHAEFLKKWRLQQLGETNEIQ